MLDGCRVWGEMLSVDAVVWGGGQTVTFNASLANGKDKKKKSVLGVEVAIVLRFKKKEKLGSSR